MARSKVNKMQLVRDALQTLGNDAMPGDIAKHILDTHKVEMSTNMVSNYKSHILKQSGQSPRRKGRRRRRGRPAASEAPVTAHTAASSDGVPWKDLRTIREMAQRLGLTRLRELVELLH